MNTQSKMLLGSFIWAKLSMVSYAAIAFLTLSFDPMSWGFGYRLLAVIAELGLIPLMSYNIVGSIARAIMRASIPQEDKDLYQKGVEDMRKAVINARPDCELQRGRDAVQRLQPVLRI